MPEVEKVKDSRLVIEDFKSRGLAPSNGEILDTVCDKHLSAPLRDAASGHDEQVVQVAFLFAGGSVSTAYAASDE